MLLNHIGITNKSKEDALRFYRDFMGFEMTRESVVPQEMSEQLFDVARDIAMLVFEKEGTKIEVFICPECTRSFPDITHIGLSLANFSAIIGKAEQAGVRLITGKTKDKTVYFIRDFSGNLVEIKQL